MLNCRVEQLIVSRWHISIVACGAAAARKISGVRHADGAVASGFTITKSELAASKMYSGKLTRIELETDWNESQWRELAAASGFFGHTPSFS